MNPNLELLCYAAARLEPLLDELVLGDASGENYGNTSTLMFASLISFFHITISLTIMS